MPHVMSFYDHTCLKAFHLGGRETTLTIERVSKAPQRPSVPPVVDAQFEESR